MALIALLFYFIAADPVDPTMVRTYGPFPSMELCRSIGDTVTNDERFWPAAKAREQSAVRADVARYYREPIARARAHPGQWVPVVREDEVVADKAGHLACRDRQWGNAIDCVWEIRPKGHMKALSGCVTGRP